MSQGALRPPVTPRHTFFVGSKKVCKEKAFSECSTAVKNDAACSQCFWVTMSGLIASSVGRLPLRRGCLTMGERGLAAETLPGD